ncbi:hypothetical protein PEC301875_27720 [Pectobacterium carotovorum subsp. carotovorum]|nr:hypothetical protein PEC301875_27720 [Pectobacterium carotovorum subsp. carotovorum]
MPRKTKTPPPVLPVIPVELLEQFGHRRDHGRVDRLAG